MPLNTENAIDETLPAGDPPTSRSLWVLSSFLAVTLIYFGFSEIIQENFDKYLGPFIGTSSQIRKGLIFWNFEVPLGSRKAGKLGLGGVRVTHGVPCHNWVTASKTKQSLRSPCLSRTSRLDNFGIYKFNYIVLEIEGTIRTLKKFKHIWKRQSDMDPCSKHSNFIIKSDKYLYPRLCPIKFHNCSWMVEWKRTSRTFGRWKICKSSGFLSKILCSSIFGLY